MTRQYDNYGRDQYNIEHAQNVTFNQTQIIQIAVATIKTRPLNATSPYRGLKPFDQIDKDYFFGRDQFLTGLVNELEQTNVILLLGASGSGKSSVVRAGLIPWLTQKWGSRLVDLTLTPDHDPFEALYGSLLKHYKQFEAQRARDGNADTLSQVVQTLKQPESFWLIFIDQFEELFTTSQPEKRDLFIQSLVQLGEERPNDQSLKIVATMRADFLDRLDLSPANRLARITEHHRPLITQMHPDELRLAIEQPAAHHGVVFESELVESIIKDVQGQAGYLPLLQYTLNRLWEEELQTGDLQQERTLHTGTYWRLGGVRGALQKHVDTIYERLQQAGKHLATQRIFLKLVEIGGDAESGTDWKPVRRRANRFEFKDEQEITVLTQLIDEKLVVSDRDLPAQTQESTVEIAHEILLTSWPLLNTWIKENRQAIALRNRLNDDVARWLAQQTDDELWTGSKLEQVLELKNDSTFNDVLGGFSASAKQFIDASESKRDRQIQAEVEHQRQQKRLYRRVATGSLTALALVTGLTGVAAWQWRESERNTIRALVQTAEARFTINRETLDALVPALNAGSQLQQFGWLVDDPNLRSQVIKSLTQTVYWVNEQNRLEGHSSFVNSVSFSRDGNTLATGSYDKTVRLWNRDGQPLLSPLKGHIDAVMGVSASPDGTKIASVSRDRTLKLWDTKTGQLLQDINPAHENAILYVAFNSAGTMLATSSEDKTIRLWKVQDNTIQLLPASFSPHTSPVRVVAFSVDGKTIASGTDDGQVLLWNLQGKLLRPPIPAYKGGNCTAISFNHDGTFATSGKENGFGVVKLWDHTGRLIHKYPGSRAGFLSVQFSPEGTLIAATDSAGTIRLWQSNGTELARFARRNASRTNSVSFGQNGLLAIGSNDNSVELWRIESPWLTLLQGHTTKVQGVAVNATDGTIATTSEDGTVRLWSPQGQQIWMQSHDKAQVIRVSFHPRQNMVVSADDEGVVNFWNTKTGNLLRPSLHAHSQVIYSVSFSPDGRVMATTSGDKTAKLWTLNNLSKPIIIPHKDAVYSASFNAIGVLATSSADGTVSFWDKTGHSIRSPLQTNTSVSAIAFSPQGSLLALGDEKGSVKLWDEKGDQLREIGRHTAAIWGVSFSSDGQMIATASDDSTIKLWKADGTLLTTLTGHTGNVNSVSFHPKDPRILVSGGQDSLGIRWVINQPTLAGLLTAGCQQLKSYRQTHSDSPDFPRQVCSTQ